MAAIGGHIYRVGGDVENPVPTVIERVISIGIEELAFAADTFIALSHRGPCKPALHDATLRHASVIWAWPPRSVFRKRVC